MMMMKICQKRNMGKKTRPQKNKRIKERETKESKHQGAYNSSQHNSKTAQNADDLYLETIHHPSRLVYIQVRDTRYQLYTLSDVCVCVCRAIVRQWGETAKTPRKE